MDLVWLLEERQEQRHEERSAPLVLQEPGDVSTAVSAQNSLCPNASFFILDVTLLYFPLLSFSHSSSPRSILSLLLLKERRGSRRHDTDQGTDIEIA
jgi:hypothetical protein